MKRFLSLIAAIALLSACNNKSYLPPVDVVIHARYDKDIYFRSKKDEERFNELRNSEWPKVIYCDGFKWRALAGGWYVDIHFMGDKKMED